MAVGGHRGHVCDQVSGVSVKAGPPPLFCGAERGCQGCSLRLIGFVRAARKHTCTVFSVFLKLGRLCQGWQGCFGIQMQQNTSAVYPTRRVALALWNYACIMQWCWLLQHFHPLQFGSRKRIPFLMFKHIFASAVLQEPCPKQNTSTYNTVCLRLLEVREEYHVIYMPLQTHDQHRR